MTRRRIPQRVKRLVFKMFPRCCECGKGWRDGTQLDIDHRRPLAKGGTNDIENLQVLCSPCNQKKGIQWPPPLAEL